MNVCVLCLCLLFLCLDIVDSVIIIIIKSERHDNIIV